MKAKLLFLLFTISLWGDDQRIIALAPSINEILFALGKGDKIVGNTTYATYPKASIKIPNVGGYFSVSLEKILALKPSLVLMQKNNLSLKPQLEKFGIKTELIRISSLNDIKKGIEKIAALTQSRQIANTIVQDIDKAIQKSKGILKDKKILIVFGRQFDLKKSVYVSGNKIYFADIIRASGNHNAYTEDSIKQPQLSYEGIIATNPDIIYILAHLVKGEEASQKLIKPWLDLPVTAAKAKTIYVSTKKYSGMPSNRVIHYIEDFTKILQDAKIKLDKL